MRRQAIYDLLHRLNYSSLTPGPSMSRPTPRLVCGPRRHRNDQDRLQSTIYLKGRMKLPESVSDRRSWFRASPLWCGARRDHVLARGCESVPHRTQRRPSPGTLGTLGQGVGSLGIGITTLGQFPTDVVHHTLDRLGRDRLVTHVSHHQPSPLERTRFRRRECHPLDQQGRQFAGIKPQRLPVGGKRPGGRPGNNLAAPRLRQGRRSRSPCVS